MSAFRDLFRVPSFAWLFGTSIIGRFPQGMVGLALMMLITQTSSYAVFSAVSAATTAGAFIAGPALSRLADARGHRRVLQISAVLHAGGTCALALVPHDPPLLIAVAFLVGVSAPPLTASLRAVLPVLVGPDRRRSAYAMEATAQEITFVLGPPVAALASSLGGPRLAIFVAAAFVLAGTVGYARDRNAELSRPPADRPREERAGLGAVLRIPGLARLLGGTALLTCALAAQVLGVAALVSGASVSADAGLVMAVGSLGSLVGGLLYGSVRRRAIQPRHLLLLVSTGLFVLALAPDTGVLSVVLFLWGGTVAPTMSRLFERLSELVPAGSATEAFGWMGSALAIGNAVGTLFAGLLVDGFGSHAALPAAAVIALLGALVVPPGGERPA
ncbi:MFS transporter [Nonomuraea sp. NPDC049158]|uniref:MFS transporter n=1 Tax=Nonomuraea sp. NPDC049158 TaxID=3155649 RepID=UPI0033EDC8FC